MDAATIRREIEGYFATAAIHGSAPHIATVNAALGARLVADLDTALDRAYRTEPRPVPAVRPQDPRYRDGTVTRDTIDHGEVTVDEPAWCIGHDDDTIGYFADITHNGPPITAPIVTARYGPSKIMTARISHAPHAVEQPEPYPVLGVELDAHGDLGPADGRNLIRALHLAAARVERAVAELDAMRRHQP
jgi:hypothetical protein